MISSLGGQVELLEALVNHASERGIKVALNPGKDEIKKLTADRRQLERIAAKLEVLLINREEMSELLGREVVDSLVWDEQNLISTPKITVMTDGKQGGQVCTGGRCWHYQPMLVETIEETGAGDAFGSGLVSALIKGKSMEDAVEWGKKQAASVVQHMGPKKGLMNLDEMV